MTAGEPSLEEVLRAISDPTRRLLLDELGRRDGQTLFELCVRLTGTHQLNLSRQAISKHLGILEAADLVRTSWKGRTKLHTRNLRPIQNLRRSWLGKYLQPREKGS